MLFDGPAPAPAPNAARVPPVARVEVPVDTLVWAAPRPKPAAKAARHWGTGTASYYGEEFAGRRTASGSEFDPTQLTAAHRTLPLGTRIRVTNTRNGRSVIVRVTDRGQFRGGRVVDLSRAAAQRIGMVQRGVAMVRIELLTGRHASNDSTGH